MTNSMKYSSVSVLALGFVMMLGMFILTKPAHATLTFDATSVVSDASLTLQGTTVATTGNATISGKVGLAGTAIDSDRYINLVQTIAPSATTYGELLSLTSSTNQSIVGGSFGASTNAVSGTTSSLVGIQGTVSNTGGTTTTFATAADSSVLVTSSSTINNAWGYATAVNAITGGNYITAKGMYSHINNLSTGTFGTSYGLHVEADNFNASGTLTTLYGVALSGWSNNGTVGTNYGIYADNSIDFGSTRYFIYSSSTSNSYIAGNVGLGTTSPQSQLQIGTTNSSSSQYIQIDSETSAPAAGDCDSDTERGRMIQDFTANRLYVCGGASRGWDYVALTD
jgi:hypothetical protein